ncbi:MAG: response regulator transcription factor [Actinomycetota bacterium]|nr:response regulator transcription factor [Actinomycetota bacterium]
MAEAGAERRTRVVLADDAEDFRAILRRLLEHDGRFEVVAEAEDGHEAVQVATDHQPDVIVLDLSMPLLDGRAALPRIRAAAPATRVIVLSGFGPLDGDDAIKLGADACIEKGAGIDEIIGIVAEVANRADAD